MKEEEITIIKFNKKSHLIKDHIHIEHHILEVGICLGAFASKALIGWKSVNEHITTAQF